MPACVLPPKRVPPALAPTLVVRWWANAWSDECAWQADLLKANDCATIVMAILEAISNAHENLAKVLEILPKLLLSVSPSRHSLCSPLLRARVFPFARACLPAVGTNRK